MKFRVILLTTMLVGCGEKEITTEPSDEVIDADGDGSPASLDCDDGDASRYPQADEVCDGIDNNCDDVIDNDAIDALEFYLDGDGDGFGVEDTTELACEAPEGFTDNIDDCDDASADISPEAQEVCDGLDNDCDGENDEDLEIITSYEDQDADGFGNADLMQEDCMIPEGFVENMNDCDDADELIGSMLEDMDCDGLLDTEDDDIDGDGLTGEEDCNDLDASNVQVINSPQTIEEDGDGDGVPDVVKSYTYDENGRVSVYSQVYDIDGDEIDDEIETVYTYNEDGSISSGDVAYDYGIDGAAEITYTFVVTQDSSGNITSSIANGSRVDGSTFGYSYTYTYDADGNRLTDIFEADWSGSGNTEESSIRAYTYDPSTGYLMSESFDALNASEEALIDGVPEDERSYTYDADGNIQVVEITFDNNSDGMDDEYYTLTYAYLSDDIVDYYTMEVDWDADLVLDVTYTYTYTYNQEELLEVLEQVVEYEAEVYQSFNYIKTTTYTYNENDDLLTTEIDNETDGAADTTYSNVYNEQGQLMMEQTDEGYFTYTYASCPQ